MMYVLVVLVVLGPAMVLPGPAHPTPIFKAQRHAHDLPSPTFRPRVSDPRLPTPASRPQAGNVKLGDLIQEFGLDLSAEVHGTGNQVVSPLSVAVLLSSLMLANDNNYDIQEALYLPFSVNEDAYHSHFQQLLQSVARTDPHITLNVANGLFVKNSVALFRDYTQKAKQHYNTSIQLVNFRQGKDARDKVNAWVNDQTQGMIPSLVTDPFSPLTTVFVANTVFFNGTWETPFDPASTYLAPFQTATETLQVPMMSKIMPVLYVDIPDLDAHMVAIPYKGAEFSMFILMRKNTVSDLQDLEDLEFSLTTEYLNRIIGNMTQRIMTIELPRMRMSYKTSLRNALVAMGITSIFDRGLNVFKRMTNEPVWVDDVVHETVIEVTETGTRASAASGAGLDRIGSSIKFLVDRPAILFIRANGPNLPLFWGRIMRPEALP